MGVEQDAGRVLLTMATHLEPGYPEHDRGQFEFKNVELREFTGLSPLQLNDAVNILKMRGYVDVQHALRTAPYDFDRVRLSALGRAAAQRHVSAPEEANFQSQPDVQSAPIVGRPLNPVGSPYGFTDQDWEAVSLDQQDSSRLIVVLGHQWRSRYFEAATLRRNIKGMFKASLQSSKSSQNVSLDFRPLAAGYGEHLFNQIARSIIAADIAVFDTSDRNPNVMIEMGVALTWGVRVLPIRQKLARELPSDISGQDLGHLYCKRKGMERP